MKRSCLQVDSQQQIPAGSEMEVELRACTIAAVEMLRHALDARLQLASPAASSPGSEPKASESALHSTAGTKGAAGGTSPAAIATEPAAMAKAPGKDSLESRKSESEQCSQGVTAVAVDWWLWGRGEAQRDIAPAHHRTLTIYY